MDLNAYMYIYIYLCIHIDTYIYLACPGPMQGIGGWGSEFALCRPPRNQEIVSCRACVRAEPMPGGNASQT